MVRVLASNTISLYVSPLAALTEKVWESSSEGQITAAWNKYQIVY
jgi:hypothetical protein